MIWNSLVDTLSNIDWGTVWTIGKLVVPLLIAVIPLLS